MGRGIQCSTSTSAGALWLGCLHGVFIKGSCRTVTRCMICSPYSCTYDAMARLADSAVHACCSRRLVPQLSRLLPPEAELDYVEFEGGHAVTSAVADEMCRCSAIRVDHSRSAPFEFWTFAYYASCHPPVAPASSLPDTNTDKVAVHCCFCNT
jgi:hypothetical protein